MCWKLILNVSVESFKDKLSRECFILCHWYSVVSTNFENFCFHCVNIYIALKLLCKIFFKKLKFFFSKSASLICTEHKVTKCYWILRLLLQSLEDSSCESAFIHLQCEWKPILAGRRLDLPVWTDESNHIVLVLLNQFFVTNKLILDKISQYC